MLTFASPGCQAAHLPQRRTADRDTQEEQTMTTTERHVAVSSEIRFRRALRDQLVSTIEGRNMSIDQLAQTVGMLPSGAQALMARGDWTLRTCLRVAESLGVDVHPKLEHRDA